MSSPMYTRFWLDMICLGLVVTVAIVLWGTVLPVVWDILGKWVVGIW